MLSALFREGTAIDACLLTYLQFHALMMVVLLMIKISPFRVYPVVLTTKY